MPSSLLTLNGGSSSIKFAAYTPQLKPLLTGQIERIGQPNPILRAKLPDNTPLPDVSIDASTHPHAADSLLTWLGPHLTNTPISAVGHRIVHGGPHLLTHQLITESLVTQLRQSIPLDPAHLPLEIALLETLRTRLPAISHIACFDTAFHRTLPRINQLLPIPLSYHRAGIRRLGFHGLSYTYLLQQLQLLDPTAAAGKVILAHLGSGCSMSAVSNGHPIDTTMSFTPTAGLVMSTRPGDLDPGLLTYLLRSENLNPDQLDELLNKRSGLAGLSESSPDLRDLQSRRNSDPRAADALDVFYLSARKSLASMAASLSGLNTLVFSGGIGQHSPETRAAICEPLSFIGLHLDPSLNAQSAPIISSPINPVKIRIIPTNEELVIAQSILQILPV